MTSLVPIVALLAAGLAAGTAAHALPEGDEAAADARLEKATFAGGCFWCMEPPFDALDGVVSTTSGYAGGRTENPGYEEVSAGGTGHAEAIQVLFDPARVTYEKLLEVFWHNVDPTDAGGQFCDRGDQYRTEIFVAGGEQRKLAEASKAALAANKPFADPIVTPISSDWKFYPAEEYHQDYYRKNPVRYKFYRFGCGRDRRLQQLWGEAGGGH